MQPPDALPSTSRQLLAMSGVVFGVLVIWSIATSVGIYRATADAAHQ